ncbi:porin family protein [Lewinella sp. W8]|uniref:porin family protein n=1 Tax=Lewinella sp. W8 TaxID=2528208 RepID=UPI00156587AB|nr:porin family protein [Lewinella sp. W8]
MRLLLFLTFVLIIPAFGKAQVTIGLKGGGTIATVNETPTLANITETGTISGLTGGVFLEFGEGLAVFRPEVLFQQRGYDYTLANIDSTFLEQFNYLDIPVTLRLRLGKPKFRIYLEGGASLGFVLDGIRRASANGNSVETDLLANGLMGPNDGESRGYDLAGIVGGGLEFKLGPGRLSFGGRYNVDLNDLYDFKDQSAPPDWREVKWRSFDFTVGYGFTLDFF